jgi:hypothetical protein
VQCNQVCLQLSRPATFHPTILRLYLIPAFSLIKLIMPDCITTGPFYLASTSNLKFPTSFFHIVTTSADKLFLPP